VRQRDHPDTPIRQAVQRVRLGIQAMPALDGQHARHTARRGDPTRLAAGPGTHQSAAGRRHDPLERVDLGKHGPKPAPAATGHIDREREASNVAGQRVFQRDPIRERARQADRARRPRKRMAQMVREQQEVHVHVRTDRIRGGGQGFLPGTSASSAEKCRASANGASARPKSGR
jgi:hypothetical protein